MNPSHQGWKNRRFSFRKLPKGKITTICRKGSLDLGPNLAVGLLDLSETGVRLDVSEELPPGQGISLTMEGPGQRRPLRFLARVIWVVPAEAPGKFRVGIALEKRLPYADFMRLTKD